MKSKILFFIIIVFLVGLKWGYEWLNSANAVEAKALNLINDNSSFDSVNEFINYKNTMLQNIYDNKVKIHNLRSALMLQDIVIKDKLEKQIEFIEFKNNQLALYLNNYKLKSITQFQFFKISFNLQFDENNQLIDELMQNHESFSKLKESIE